ncbi:MAG: hypothetical protein PHX21_13635, partial [bacterium]|nr:hypothetical protein [bacterium]
KGVVSKEYLPADTTLTITVTKQEDGSSFSLPDSLLEPSSLWVPNNSDSPVAEFKKTIAFPGNGTYKISCKVKNPANLESDVEETWVKVAVSQATSIIVHCHNPEGREIASIQGMNGMVIIFDGDTVIGYGANNSETHNKPITISSGTHTIKATFNGMTKEETITLNPNETRTITFTFDRTEWSLGEFLSELGGSNTFEGSWDPILITPSSGASYWRVSEQGSLPTTGYGGPSGAWQAYGHSSRVSMRAEAKYIINSTSATADAILSGSFEAYQEPPAPHWPEEGGSPPSGDLAMSVGAYHIGNVSGLYNSLFNNWFIQGFRTEPRNTAFISIGTYLTPWSMSGSGEATGYFSRSLSAKYSIYDCIISIGSDPSVASARKHIIWYWYSSEDNGQRVTQYYSNSGNFNIESVKVSSVPYDLPETGI